MEIKNRNPKIYIICGKARHGKDTIGGFIKEAYKDKDFLAISYNGAIKEYAKKISGWDGSEETKPRTLLQQLGTDVVRKNIDYMFFTDRLMNDIKVYSYYFDVLTITDARFKVEIDTPRKMFDNVIAIKVVRPNFDNGLTEEQKNHPTEVDLDDYENFDYTIINDGTLEDLKQKVEKLIEVIENES